MHSADTVVQASVDFGLSGEVGLGAVLIGVIGLVVGLARHGRKRRSVPPAPVAEAPASQPVQS